MCQEFRQPQTFERIYVYFEDMSLIIHNRNSKSLKFLPLMFEKFKSGKARRELTPSFSLDKVATVQVTHSMCRLRSPVVIIPIVPVVRLPFSPS